MRDIREELEERVRALELQIGGINAFFEQQVERLKKERDSRLTELKNQLEAVTGVLNFERQRASQAIPQEPARPQLGNPAMHLNGNGLASVQLR
jgi:hypothetical protein